MFDSLVELLQVAHLVTSGQPKIITELLLRVVFMLRSSAKSKD
jgi:hypothetical protein